MGDSTHLPDHALRSGRGRRAAAVVVLAAAGLTACGTSPTTVSVAGDPTSGSAGVSAATTAASSAPADASVAPPASAPGRLPRTWTLPPADLPTIQQKPVEAAVLVLQQDKGMDGAAGEPVGDLVVVPADGSGYRRVPGVTRQSLLQTMSPRSVLSPDGRRLVWVSSGRGWRGASSMC